MPARSAVQVVTSTASRMASLSSVPHNAHTMSPRGKRWSEDQPRATEPPRPIARALLIALAVVLPFEAPILKLPPLTITTVELVLYLLLAVWGIGLAVRVARTGSRRAAWNLSRAALTSALGDPIVRAVTLWLAVIVVSALTAPALRVPALKFALRTLGGGLLFFAARGLIRSAADTRAVALGLLMGALLSAAGGVVESVLPNTSAFWHFFRTATFSVTGLPARAAHSATPPSRPCIGRQRSPWRSPCRFAHVIHDENAPG